MKRSTEAFEAAQLLIKEYTKEGWPKQDKHSTAHMIYLGFMRSEFISLALDVSESSDETVDLIVRINEQFNDWIHHNDCPALMNGSSGNLAYMFEPEAEYYYRNPLIDALLKYYQDNGLPLLLTLDIENLANNLPNSHAMMLDELHNCWPDFYEAIHQLQNSYKDVAAFFTDYNETHKIIENPSGAMYEVNR
jgi:hypothetical protein